jgi:hypothetical protein
MNLFELLFGKHWDRCKMYVFFGMMKNSQRC